MTDNLYYLKLKIKFSPDDIITDNLYYLLNGP